VVINDLRENTFFARIHLTRGRVDASRGQPPERRDRAGAARAGGDLRRGDGPREEPQSPAEGSEQDPERLRKWLEEASSDELGKYRM
jgi:hypothetical protein